MKYILFFSLQLLPITLYAQTDIIKVLEKSKNLYQEYFNGKISYTSYVKHLSRMDTSTYQVHLHFHKYKMGKNQVKVFLDYYATENENTFYLQRSMDRKKAYYILFTPDDTTFTTHSRKIFINNPANIYSLIPAMNNSKLFDRLLKAKKTLTTTATHYIISTQKAQFYIHQKTYQIDKIKYQSYGAEGEYYEYVEIEHQSYNQPEFENERLYRLEKPSNSQKLEKIKRSETLLPVGTDAPAWTLANIETGDSLSLQDLKGKVIVLDFWYTSCPPCIEFLPKMKKLRQEFKNEEVVFIGMAYDKYAENIVQHLQKYAGGISYPNVLCSLAARKKYKVHAMPAFFVIDQAQKVRYARTGTLLTEEILRKQIKKCLKK